MTTVGSIAAPNYDKAVYAKNINEIPKDKIELSGKTTQQLEDVLNALSSSGQMLVNNHFHKVMNEHGQILNKALKIEKEFHQGENSYSSVGDFKEAGGIFDKDGAAYIINPDTGEKEVFTGIIRLDYKINPETHNYFNSRTEAWDTRDYAKFDENGYLSTVVHLEYSGAKIDEITYEKGSDHSPNAIISTKSTEVVPRQNADLDAQKTILSRYGIA